MALEMEQANAQGYLTKTHETIKKFNNPAQFCQVKGFVKPRLITEKTETFIVPAWRSY